MKICQVHFYKTLQPTFKEQYIFHFIHIPSNVIQETIKQGNTVYTQWVNYFSNCEISGNDMRTFDIGLLISAKLKVSPN